MGNDFRNCFLIEEVARKDIAIIGISAKFSNADNKDEYWRNLLEGKDCIKTFPVNRIEDMEPFCEYLKGYIKHFDFSDPRSYSKGGYLDDISSFDYNYFKLSPNDVSLMDPCQRLFLQGCVEAITDAGYGGGMLSGSNTGVYAAFCPDFRDFTYKYFIKRTNMDWVPLSLNKNLTCSLPSWIAYVLDLKGPNICIDTGCSAGLVALHLACRAIRNEECENAIVGGVKIDLLPIDLGLKIGIESDDGYCRAFDENANGTGIGEGVGALLVKSLHQAIMDEDEIYAVIKGSAVNSDGSSRGITLPNVDGQAEVILKAIKDANINPETIDYIEAHGTATKVGDPIEVEGITKAFRRYTDKKQFCAVSSVKSNIGHLYEASGIASVIKAALALKNGKIPQTLNFKKENEKINFKESPIFINRELRKWKKNGHKRRCGVSAFGITGTNSHVILEEAPAPALSAEKRELIPQIFVISGVSKSTMLALIDKYIAFLSDGKSIPLSDLCYSNNTINGHYECRIAFLVSSVAELVKKLKATYHQLSNNNESIVSMSSDKGSVGSQAENRSSVKTIVNEMSGSGGKWTEENLKKLANLYLEGHDISWKKIFSGKGFRRVITPITELQKIKCWLKADPVNIERVKKRKNQFFEQAWVERKTDLASGFSLKGPVIVINESMENDKELVRVLDEKKIKTINIARAAAENEELMRCLGQIETSVDLIFLQKNITKRAGTIEELDNRIENGLICFFSILKLLVDKKLSERVRITLITNDAFTVDAVHETDAHIIPENTCIYGLIKTAKRELPGLKIKAIDTDNATHLDLVLNEIEKNTEDLICAFRRNRKFVQQFCFLDLASKSKRDVTIDKDDVFIVTGGNGGIGLSLASYLSSKNQCTLVLISRTGKTKDTLSEKAIKEMRKSGSVIELCQADCADTDQMTDVINDIREKYGQINGVFHCAGVVAENLIKDQSINSFKSIIRSKIHGTYLLDQLTAYDNLKIFMLFSSVACVFPAMMQGDYAAANTYLDAFAKWRNLKRNNSISINWVAWKETGMAFDVNANIDTIFKGLETEKGIAAVDVLKNYSVENAFVGQINYAYKYLHKIYGYNISIDREIVDLIDNVEKENKRNTPEAFEKKNTEVELTGRDEKTANYTHLERQIAGIWSDKLGYETLNIHDSFYDLGGDSILALNIINKVNERFDVQLKIQDIMERPSISSMAEMVEEQMESMTQKEEDKKQIIIKEPSSVDEIEKVPATWQQRQYYDLQSVHKNRTLFNNHMFFLLEGTIDIEKLENAFQELVNRHEILRTYFELDENDRLIQVIKNRLDFTLEQVKKFDLKKPDWQKRYIGEFDLHRAPLIRAFLLKVALERHLLVVDIHHIVSDGVSMPIITEELLKLYQGEILEKALSQYKDYALYQHSDEYNKKINEQEDYWMEMTGNESENFVKIPYDFPNANNDINKASHCSFVIDSSASRKITAFCKKHELTLFMFFVAAIKILLWKLTDQKHIVVGTYANGRNNAQFEKLIGIFVNKVFLKDRLYGDLDVLSLLRNVKRTMISAMESQDYPFEKLAKRKNIANPLEKNALFNVFVLNNVFSRKKYKIEDLKVKPVPIESSESLETNYDLTFMMVQNKQNIHFAIVYSDGLFKGKTIQGFGANLLTIISNAVEYPDKKIKDIN